MDTVALHCERGFSLESMEARLARRWPVDRDAAGGLVVQGGAARVYIHRPSPTELYLDYSDASLVKQVIMIVGDDADFLIDNDFGTLLPGDRFVARLRADPEWDWRVTPETRPPD